MGKKSCPVCGVIYDPEDAETAIDGVETGTAFGDIDWSVAMCFLCGNDSPDGWEDVAE